MKSDILAVQVHTKSVQAHIMASVMTKNGEELWINRCLRLIEDKLGWGASEDWVNYDFEKLSDTIHEQTHVRLSVTTLKRIWGKLKYESTPTLTTLNTLAQFAGYQDWRTFKQKENSTATEKETNEAIPSLVNDKPANKKNNSFYWLMLFIPLALAGYALIARKENNQAAADVDKNLFSFRADKVVTEGVPNSVVFHYSAKAAKTDSVFIVQTWDFSKKKTVPRNGTTYSAIYYYPGYFRAKLVAGNTVVKEHDLWITSNGWLCAAEDEPVPLYFKKEECAKDNGVEVNEVILKAHQLTLHPKPPRIRIYNQRDLGDLASDNFMFETTLKNDFSQGINACQYVQVLIHCKNDIIILPLAAKTCVGNLELAFCGYEVTSKDADLSKFGADLMQWTHLRVETKNKQATIYVNDAPAYSLTFQNEATDIVGVQYRFNGTGAVKDTWFESKGRRIPL